jgi:hypothetical protein
MDWRFRASLGTKARLERIEMLLLAGRNWRRLRTPLG